MRFIGGKSLMLNHILEIINQRTENVSNIVDMFSGSGVVAKFLKEHNYNVITNDLMFFSYAISRGTLDLNEEPKFEGLNIKNPIRYLNNLTLEKSGFDIDDCFIYQNYSPNSHCERMYLQCDNAIKIDIIRMKIEEWKAKDKISEDEYFYLLASLLSAVPYVSNIAGVYGAYLKKWDVRTYNPLALNKPQIINNDKACHSFNEDANMLAKVVEADLAYLDPPYNSRQYLPNYHVLETIAKYDNPQIKGVSGMRNYDNQKSNYCRKKDVLASLDDLIHGLNVKYIIMSYNNEGLLSSEQIEKVFKKYGIAETYSLYEFDYRRYKSKIPNNGIGLKEQLYFIRKF